MAPNRPGRERRLASLIIIAVLLASCGRPTAPESGWFAPEPVTSIEVSAEIDAILISVVLPPGYEAADDFVQRATLRSGERSVTVEQSGLETAIRVAVPQAPTGGDGAAIVGEAGLELLLGFCESTVKEVCYIDAPRLPVRYTAGSRAPGPVAVTYSPERPK